MQHKSNMNKENSKKARDLRKCDGLTGNTGKSQETDREDQGRVKERGWIPQAVLRFAGLSGLPSGSSLFPCQSITVPYVTVCWDLHRSTNSDLTCTTRVPGEVK